jgi:hypothetical protein
MSDQLTVTPVVLELAAQAFADATADPPCLFELGLVPAAARHTLEVNVSCSPWSPRRPV